MTEPARFRARGTPGFLPEVARDARAVRARKRETDVRVEFATGKTLVHTAEGTVHVQSGDAIVTGADGEQWPVSRSGFSRRYRPVRPAPPGADGDYRSVPHDVLAIQMGEPFTVVLTDGRSELRGEPGDWLVDHGDGSLGVVAQSVFAETYELLA